MMARFRSRSRSLSPRGRSRTPPRDRKRYEDDRRCDDRSPVAHHSPSRSGLLVRNLPLDARPEDLRIPFERFGPVKDIYLPRNYYTGEPRGFGFVKFCYPEDAAEAKQRMNYKVIGGREIRIVYAEENRKTPQEMRMSTSRSGRFRGSHRRSPPRSPRRRYHSYSHSPPPARTDSRDRRVRDDYRLPQEALSVSRSGSPPDKRDNRSKQMSPSPRPRLVKKGHSPHDERNRGWRRSRSPRGNNRSPSRSRSCSISPR